jgi:hypothetical protein
VAYRQPAFLALLERLYDLERIPDLFWTGSENSFPPFFRSRKPFRRRDGFMLPFQFYASADLPTAEATQAFFQAMQDWSGRTGGNLTFSSLDDYGISQSQLVARNPILFLASDSRALEAGFSHNLRSSLKRNANKAQRMGIEIDESRQESDLRAFYYGVLAPQYLRKHRMVFHPYGLYRGLLEAGMAHLVIARRGGRLIGGLVLVADGDGVHYAWGASETQDQVAVGTLMLRHALEFSIARGLRWFDFGSTPLTDTALHDFKLRWGATSFPVLRYYTLRPPSVIDLNASFTLPRKLYSFLPPSLACALMPRIVPWLVA